MLKLKSIIIALVGFIMLIPAAYAADDKAKEEKPKWTLKEYNQLPGQVESFTEMFTQGMYYGRLRSNNFYWDWKDSMANKGRDNWATAIGGSFTYKTGYLHGLGMTAGLYTSQNLWHMDGDNYTYVKAGKDLFSRYDVATEDSYDMTVLAEAFLEYKFMESNIKVGRQIFESYLTSANDTKMIPNTFQGVSLGSELIPDTELKAAWFPRQKLRDHTDFHHVLAFGDDPDNPNASWTENDDAAMHKGFKESKLDAENIDDELYIFQAENESIKNLAFMANYTGVPELVESAAAEVNYTIPVSDDIKVIPGVRYMRQFDDGGGEIGGASLSGKVKPGDQRGYSDPDSLDSGLFMAKVNLKKGFGNFQVGYSKVDDEADIVAPWRGFPTGGYTRAMGQYNWYANTETWMLQTGYDFGKAKIIPGFSTMVAYAIQDFDDEKPDTQADSNVLWMDFVQNIKPVPGLSAKLRLALVDSDDDTVDMTGKVKPDSSYNEYRFEMNYLF